MNALLPQNVFCATSSGRVYSDIGGIVAPELQADVRRTNALALFRALLKHSRLDEDHFGSSEWNPLSALIREGDRVLIKPNWVNHVNASGHGEECLVTHTSVIEAILTYVLKAKPSSVVIGDAPIQGCDFNALLSRCGVQDMLSCVDPAGPPVSVKDLRRIVLPEGRLGSRPSETARVQDEYITFDLGPDSYLEPISSSNANFRVTMYDPRELERTHAPGRHQYLIAAEAIEADVVINVPKLKTHAKACLTGALKNLVGINGHKKYLPHHRKGGSVEGGDCYSGKSGLKSIAEFVLDRINRSSNSTVQSILALICRIVMAAGKVSGSDSNVEGSWYGNDTVWRMCLDLQRILHYGKPDGTIGDIPQRKVLTITDAIIAGEGEGPLAPTPVPFGMMTMGINTAAVEWVNALLMSFDPQRIPLTRNAFDSSVGLPLATFSPGDIIIHVNGNRTSVEEIVERYARPFVPASGWLGHCELHSRQLKVAGRS